LNLSDSEPIPARHRHKIEKNFSRPIRAGGKKIVSESRPGVVINLSRELWAIKSSRTRPIQDFFRE
jgi:hypothetical protein